MQWAQGLHVGLLVQGMRRFVKTGMEHIKNQLKKTKKEKKMPLFLKHLNGWHQNVKRNNHFKKI